MQKRRVKTPREARLRPPASSIPPALRSNATMADHADAIMEMLRKRGAEMRARFEKLRAAVADEPEPPTPVDVFEEPDCILVVAEMPGVEAADVKVELDGRRLRAVAERGDRCYRVDIALPVAVARDGIEVACNNGVVGIRCPR